MPVQLIGEVQEHYGVASLHESETIRHKESALCAVCGGILSLFAEIPKSPPMRWATRE